MSDYKKGYMRGFAEVLVRISHDDTATLDQLKQFYEQKLIPWQMDDAANSPPNFADFTPQETQRSVERNQS